MAGNAREMLELLVQHELAIKSLYLAYAAVFDDIHEFWNTLAAEEQGHADRLDDLREEPGLDEWLTPETRLRSAAVESSIDYLKDQTTRAHQSHLTLVQALAVAKDVEDALIDRQFLLPASSVFPQIERTISVLRVETERHRQVIADALETAKRLEV